MQTVAESQFAAALQAAEGPQASAEERAEMLMEIAMSLQLKPKSPQQLHDAVTLYGRALEQQPSPLLAARIRSRLGTALQCVPDGGGNALRQACQCYESAMPELAANGKPEEAAESQMNFGLALQGLAGMGLGRIQDAIQCYHRALRVFSRETHPQELPSCITTSPSPISRFPRSTSVRACVRRSPCSRSKKCSRSSP